MEARLSRYEVTPAQSHVLLYLFSHGGQAPQCEVTEYLKVKPSTANGILDRMAEKELVVRSVSAATPPPPDHPDREGAPAAGAVRARHPGGGDCHGAGLYPTGNGAVPGAAGANDSEFRGGPSDMTKYMRPYAGWIVLGVVCSAAEAVFELLIPLVMSDIVDVGIATGDQSYILQKSILMVVMAMVSLCFGLGAAACSATAGWASARVCARRSTTTFRITPFQHREVLHGVPGDPLTNDVNNLQMTLMFGMRLLVRAR
jgi:hypothetical protein